MTSRAYWTKLTTAQRVVNVLALCVVVWLLVSLGQLVYQNAIRPAPSSLTAFSDGRFTVFFAQPSGRLEAGVDYGETWTVRTDGTLLARSNKKREEAVADVSRGISESMGRWYGDFESFDGQRRIVMQSGIVPFGQPTIAVKMDGIVKSLLTTNVVVVRWLPDNRRLIFWDTRGGNGVIDTTTGQYAYLVNGWPFVGAEENSEYWSLTDQGCFVAVQSPPTPAPTPLCSVTPSLPYCLYQGQQYAPTERFAAGDGCNTCVCDAETISVVCTEMACVEEDA